MFGFGVVVEDLHHDFLVAGDAFAEFVDVLVLVAVEKGGFLLAHWDGTAETEEAIKAETKATIRCIPLNSIEQAGKCVYSGKPSAKRVVFARAY